MPIPAVLVRREEWGAREARQTTAIHGVKGIAIHYSGADADEQADHHNCAARVRGIQRFHMDTRGWADIAYSWLACKHGYLYEGRGPNRRTAAQGTNSGNDAYLAVCFLGDDTVNRDDVTDAGRAALQLAIDITRRAWPGANDIRPHSAFHSTSCPGDQLREWIRNTGHPTPTTPLEDDMPFTNDQLIAAAKAGALAALDEYGTATEPGGKKSNLLGRLDRDTDVLGPIQQSVEKILKTVSAGAAGTGLAPAQLAAALRAAADRIAPVA